MRLGGRRVIVTGANGGIGSAIVTAFADAGATVAGLSRSGPFACDVTDVAGVEKAVVAAVAHLGGLDHVVHAAAIDQPAWARVAELDPDDWRRVVDVDLNGAFHVARAVLPHLVAGGGGTIVAITSVAGLRVWELDAAYVAAKAGVEMLIRQIAAEYGRDGVRACCVAPGVIDAGMTDAVDDAERAALTARHRLGRLGRAEEVAAACLYLCAEGTFTTGATLTVDGGFTT
jgi:NAD(P)-dependent dehydrogenase (short-subunit alcohol dehydrogenase family)